jgi:hypothetical protein
MHAFDFILVLFSFVYAAPESFLCFYSSRDSNVKTRSGIEGQGQLKIR